MPTIKSRLKAVAAANAPVAGVAITITPHGNTHTGIVYRNADDEVKLLHLAFHLDLCDDDLDSTYLCADPELEHEDAEAIAGHCRLIAKEMPPIWFAIHYNAKARLAKHGNKIVLTKEGKGLSCSTFVLAVFNSAGPALIDDTGWPKRDEDKPWHVRLVSFLRAKGAPEWYVRKVANDIGCARVRPEEVAGACLETDQPVSFVACVANGQYVNERAASHTGRLRKW